MEKNTKDFKKGMECFAELNFMLAEDDPGIIGDPEMPELDYSRRCVLASKISAILKKEMKSEILVISCEVTEMI